MSRSPLIAAHRGTAGGNIVAQGTVRQLSRAKSPTAPFIKAELER